MKRRKAEKGVIILNQEALQYGEKACAAMMKHYRNSADIPPKGGFHYHAGVFLSGMMEMYRVNGKEEYFDYVKNWVDNIVTAPGIIQFYMKGSLDDYMAGILLFPLFERTQDEKYSKTLDMLMANIRNWARNEYGGFWHKEWRPNQMWLDGLYMAGPLQALYGRATGKTYFSDEAVRQAVLMYEHMQDKKTKLLYHAWDASKEIEWCDKQTGLAPEFWGRAMGWYVVAILNIMECLEKTSENYQKLECIEREVLTAVLSFQNPKDKLWYQVLDKAERKNNWAEASCSCLFVYALTKVVRMGVLGSECLEAACFGFEAIVQNFTSRDEEGDFVLNKTCIGTGVMDYEGYINRPTVANDLHGTTKENACVIALISSDKHRLMMKKIEKKLNSTVMIANKDNAHSFVGSMADDIDFRALNSDSGIETMTINGEKSVLCYVASEITGWKYISVKPSRVFWAKSMFIRLLWIASFFFCVIVGGFMVFFLSGKNYKPIKNIADKLELYAAGKSDNNEFDRIEEAISHLSARYHDLRSYLKSQEESLKNNFLSNFLKNEKENLNLLFDELDDFDIAFPYSDFIVILADAKQSAYNEFKSRNIGTHTYQLLFYKNAVQDTTLF